MTTPHWWQTEGTDSDGQPVYRCSLCAHKCRIEVGTVGRCGVRGADENGFISPCLGWFSACAVDPIEKKPLLHFQPGTQIFSLGSMGCNMFCPFCQNHHLAHPRKRLSFEQLTPTALLTQVVEQNLTSVAYTYNEPLLQAEFIVEAAPMARERKIATVLVTNGMFSDTALEDLTPWLDAVNIDLKTFNKKKYAQMGGSLKAVQNTISYMAQAGIHVELTTLVVPGISDDRDEFAELVDWVAGVSNNIPLHISRYFPANKYHEPPTDVNLMKTFHNIAKGRLRHVHLGNIHVEASPGRDRTNIEDGLDDSED
ncbi:hypothetical protein C4J81_18205 [Deltaproteobacteria bacterium Smac51]|nr:hypothetical protein C4J81_18205 [Deltaproteobacteria bacterium Smac51]